MFLDARLILSKDNTYTQLPDQCFCTKALVTRASQKKRREETAAREQYRYIKEFGEAELKGRLNSGIGKAVDSKFKSWRFTTIRLSCYADAPLFTTGNLQVLAVQACLRFAGMYEYQGICFRTAGR